MMIDPTKKNPTMHLVSGDHTSQLAYPELISWDEKAGQWLPISNLAVWNDKSEEWFIIQLADKSKEMEQAIFAFEYSGHPPMIPVPPDS